MFGKKKKKEADSDEEPEAEAKEAEAGDAEPLDPTTLAFHAMRRSQRRFGLMLLVLVLLLALGGSAGEIYMLRADMGVMNQRLDAAVSGMKDSLTRIQDQTAATRVGIDVTACLSFRLQVTCDLTRYQNHQPCLESFRPVTASSRPSYTLLHRYSAEYFQESTWP